MPGLPKPIRVERRMWVCMRNDPVIPKAEIRYVRVTPMAGGPTEEKYRVVTWQLESRDRRLIGYYDTLGEANAAVLYDVTVPDSVVLGQDAFGSYKAASRPVPRRYRAEA